MPTIKEVPRVDRPREKLLAYGPNKLSTSELLAILLRTGTAGLNAVEVGRNLLRRFGIKGLATASVSDLSQTLGVGTVKALEIVAALELGRRALHQKQAALLLSPAEVFAELKDIIPLKKEHCLVFYLDTVHQIIKREVVAIGILNASLIHPREIFEPAVRQVAAEIIIAHNHPSGDPTPSENDIILTKRLAEAGQILGITLLDHVIVGARGYISLKDKGIIS